MLNSLLLAGVAAMAIGAWYLEAVSLGIIAVAIALVMRIRFMSDWILWEVASLFENIGTVQDGLNTIAQEPAVQDAPDAGPLTVPRGEIRFEALRFGYERPDGQGRRVFDGLDLTIAPGEKVGLIGRSGAGKSTLANLLLRFFDLEGGRILIDGQEIAGVTQDSRCATANRHGARRTARCCTARCATTSVTAAPRPAEAQIQEAVAARAQGRGARVHSMTWLQDLRGPHAA